MTELLPVFGALPHWAMGQNLVLQAGAGTGKTHALVTLALHLLSGANARGKPVPPSRLVALTFTEKAGAEMRDRLDRRMAPLADGAALEDREPELARTFAVLGQKPPSAAFWAKARRDLTLCTVGTFHSFCAAELRRLAATVGLDPSFTVLDDSDARALFIEASEAAVFEALVSNDESVRALVDEYGLDAERPKGLILLAREVLEKLFEDGIAPATLDDGRFDDVIAHRALAAALERLKEATNKLSGNANLEAAREELRTALSESTTTDEAAELLLHRVRTLRKSFRKPRGDAGLAVETLDTATEDFATSVAGLRTAPLGRAFVRLLVDIDARYRQAKEAQDALDFSDLQRTLRDLLAGNAQTRADVKARIDALLVDEFQDTSRLQLDLVALLAEERSVTASVASTGAAASVTFEPGLLCVVGDRKQSIYEFRGADVAVFSTLVEATTGKRAQGRPARIERLSKSWRSRPALVHFVNELFKQSMPLASEPFEVAFEAGDALIPQMEESSTGPLVEVLEAQGSRAEEHRADEAERIAARIDELLHDPARSLSVRDRKGWRPVEGRDLALLFRRLTNLDVYRQALARRGLAHVVVGGSGFYESLEVSDAWAFLRVLVDPHDALAMATVLRSNFCLLGDTELVRWSLAKGRPRSPTLEALRRDSNVGEGQQRLDALLRFVARYAPELDRLGCVEVLSRGIDELDYLAVAAVQTDAEQAAANLVELERVLADLERRESTSTGVVRALGERIREGRRAPGAPASEESDPRAIRLMTIHQSKGLEFPVVFICDAGAKETADTDPVAYERDLGLALSVRALDGGRLAGPGLAPVRARKAARAAAESLRLLYVAATRAKDHLFFTGARTKGSWMERVAALPEHVRTGDVDITRAFAQEKPASPSAVPAFKETALGPLAVTEATVTVTRLQDFGLCPERYRLRHDLGLDEHPPALVLTADGDEETGDASLGALERGTLSHRLLERFDFAPLSAEERRERLDTLIRAEGYSASEAGVLSLRADVEAFLDTPDAHALGKATRRLRELPFFLRIGLDDGRAIAVKGQIDLVALDASGIRVVDYKQSRATSLPEDAYDFQLLCYALAARELTAGASLPLETSVVFLADRGAIRTKRLTPDDIAAFEQRLRTLGASLLDAYALNAWSRRSRSFCDAIRCGYRSRCFGRSSDSPRTLELFSK